MTPKNYLPPMLRSPWPVAIGCMLLATVLVFSGTNPFAGLDRRWNDLLLRARFATNLSPKPDERLFVIGLESDDFLNARSSSAEYTDYAQLIDMLSALEVRVVAFDLILARGSADDSEKLRTALQSFGKAVLGEALEHGQHRRSFPFAPPEFRSGLINAAPDPDGVFRRYSYGMADEHCAPSLALSAYLTYLDVDGAGLSCREHSLHWRELARDGARIVERSLPTRNFVLDFRSAFSEPWDRGFRYLTVTDLRKKFANWRDHRDAGGSPPKGLPGKGDVVLIGSMVSDAGPTPFGSYEPLITLHATALSDLLQARMLTEAGPLWTWLVAVAGLALVALASSRTRSHATFFLISGAAVASVLVTSGAALLTYGIVLAAITPAVFMLTGWTLEAGRRAGVGSLETARTRETLGRYFSPRVLEQVLAHPDQVEPREVEITVLLTDVRNFTTITERFGVRRTFDLMNEVFEVETGVVLDLDGSMEHFVGDQFVAYWGAPQALPDATDRAVEAAKRIVQGLDSLKRTWEPELVDLFGFGVALHSGKALVGNKGSRRRLDYGILGDIINAAARIESLTKHYGVRQIASKQVIEENKTAVASRFLDRIRVKGKTEPLELFELVHDPNSETSAIHRQYELAWQSYADGDFGQATRLLTPLAPTDPPSRVLLARCTQFQKERPELWDGIFQFAEK